MYRLEILQALCAMLLMLAWPMAANQQTATVPAGMAPDTVAVNPVTSKIYVTNENGDTLMVIDGPTNTTTTVRVGTTPDGASINTVTNKI